MEITDLPKSNNVESPILIDQVFNHGESTVSYLGRNDSIIKFGLDLLPQDPHEVLILGSGPYELWTTAGQKRVVASNVHIIGVDKSEKVTLINNQVQERGSAPLTDIFRVVGNPVFGKEKQQKTSSELLEESGIGGVVLTDNQVTVDNANISRVNIAPAEDALAFVAHVREERERERRATLRPHIFG